MNVLPLRRIYDSRLPWMIRGQCAGPREAVHSEHRYSELDRKWNDHATIVVAEHSTLISWTLLGGAGQSSGFACQGKRDGAAALRAALH